MKRKSFLETISSRSQIAILKQGEHRKYLPYAFTEQGVAMLSSVLNSKETKVTKHDKEIQSIFDAIHKLIEPTINKSKRKIGFQVS